MRKFETVSGQAVPLMQPNMDTDVIIRIERLSQKPRAELGQFAFEALRYREDGTLDPDFVLNDADYSSASILIADWNFGCGSSREGAVGP